MHKSRLCISSLPSTPFHGNVQGLFAVVASSLLPRLWCQETHDIANDVEELRDGLALSLSKGYSQPADVDGLRAERAQP